MSEYQCQICGALYIGDAGQRYTTEVELPDGGAATVCLGKCKEELEALLEKSREVEYEKEASHASS